MKFIKYDQESSLELLDKCIGWSSQKSCSIIENYENAQDITKYLSPQCCFLAFLGLCTLRAHIVYAEQ